MALFGLFKKDKRKDPEYKFSEEDAEKSLIIRKENAIKKKYAEIQMERLQHLQDLQNERHMEEKIRMMEDEIYGEDEEDDHTTESDPFAGLFSDIVRGAMQKMNVIPQATPGASNQSTIENEKILETIKNIPQTQIEILKKMTVEDLTKLTMEKFPGLTSDQVSLVIDNIHKR